jgi:lipoate-protein ligase A
VEGVTRSGTSDLTIPGTQSSPRQPLKFSGNSLRIKRGHLLYHGTILYNFALDRVARWLGTPARQPEYREGRGHLEFLTNASLPREELMAAISNAWNATEPLRDWPRARTEALASERYARDFISDARPRIT